jgi:hypothetical protein
MATRLEDFLVVWRQSFFRFWNSPEALRGQFRSGDVRRSPYDKHDVVIFRDRDEYVAQLGRHEPQIAVTLGYYSKGRRTSFFYHGEAPLAPTWYHETTHQLLQESGTSIHDPGERANCWIVEGVALYVESLATHPDYVTLGGFDAERLQYARARRLSGDFFLPLTEMVRLGRVDLQRHPDLRKLYSQATGYAHLLMDHDQGRHRGALVDYLSRVYLGRDTETTLAELTGMTWDDLDSAYVDFLQVRDRDLAGLATSGTPPTGLWLGTTAVTDAGMKHLARTDLSQLQWLDLSATKVSDAGFESLGEAQSLRRLYLASTNISDRSTETIGRFRRLEELDLSGTDVTDGGLASLESLEELKILWLADTDIGDDALASLQKLDALQQLDISRTAISGGGRRRLQRGLPHLKFVDSLVDK